MTGLSGIMEVVQGDITVLDVDAVVNAANRHLAGGGGVDGAIHRAAGPELLAACRDLGSCPTGEARITGGFGLKARWVIHAVGPIWRGGNNGEAELLAGAYANSMRLALEAEAATVAFPAISTGVYGFPKEPAARIAVRAVGDFIAAHPAFERVLFVCFSAESAGLHKEALAEYLAAQKA